MTKLTKQMQIETPGKEMMKSVETLIQKNDVSENLFDWIQIWKYGQLKLKLKKQNWPNLLDGRHPQGASPVNKLL